MKLKLTLPKINILRAILVLAVSAIIFMSCSYTGIKGNGRIVTQTRDVEEFSSLETGGIYKIYLNQGNEPALRIEADENIIDKIGSGVDDQGTLKIETRDHLKFTKTPVLYITLTEIENIEVSGAASLQGKSTIVTRALKLSAHGASSIELVLDVNELLIDIEGAGKASLQGRADKVKSNINGAGKLSALSLKTVEHHISISGAGKAETNVEQILDVDITGAGKIAYVGDPDVKQHVMGAGIVTKLTKSSGQNY